MSALGLTSGALIGLAAVASAALIVISLAEWHRAAQPGTRHVLARFGLLLASNVAVTCLIFLAVNRVFGFYASWAELLGTSTSTGVVRAASGQTPSPPASPGGTGGGQPGPPGPLRSGGPLGGQVPTAGGSIRVLSSQSLTADGGQQYAGELQAVRVYGGRSGLFADGYLYLPPQYTAAGQAGHPFAVVVVISDGIAVNAVNAVHAVAARQLALTAYDQVAAGQAAPAIYVMLPATVAPGDQACLDVPSGPQAGTFFAQDLPSVLRAAYRVPAGPAGWGLLGADSGGYCAVRLAMASSDRYALAAAPAAGYQVPPGIPRGQDSAATPPHGSTAAPSAAPAASAARSRRTPAPWLFGGSSLLQDEANMIWRLRQLPPPPVTVLFTGASRGDLGQAHAFISAVRPPMRAGTVTLAPPSASSAPSAPESSSPPSARSAGGRQLAPVVDRVSRELSAWD